jgi:hypothetical protein
MEDFEVKANLLPVTNEVGYIGKVDKIWDVIRAVTLYLKYAVYFGPDYAAKLWAETSSLLATNAAFEALSLQIGWSEVITAARVLQNVITSGRFPFARLPDGSVGTVLEAQGGGSDPTYVDPNGRYQSAAHNHNGETLTPWSITANDIHSGLVDAWEVDVHSLVVSGGVNCTNWHAADIFFKNDFRITEAEKLGFKKGLAFLNQKGKVLMMLDGEGNLHVAGKIKAGLPKSEATEAKKIGT